MGAQEEINELVGLAEKQRDVDFFKSDIFDRRTISSGIANEFERIFDDKNENKRSIRNILEDLVSNDGSSWNKEDEQRLADVTESQYYDFFKSPEWRGEDLMDCIYRCLGMGRFSNPSEQQAKILSRSEAALRKIAGESRINRIRVIRLGVKLEDDE